MRILVTGREGQVVSALAEQGPHHGHEIIRLGRPDFDLAAPDGMRAALEAHCPDLVVSAAAYTAVDQAESEPELAMAVNGRAPGMIAAAAAEFRLPIIHLSTDYVFDGLKPTPYVETDATGPEGVYGQTKLAGERAVAEANPRHVILRTSWVYAHGGKNFVRTMLRLAADRPELRVVSDQFGCPTYATDLACAILDIAGKLPGGQAGDERFGVFHASGTGDTSWAVSRRPFSSLPLHRAERHRAWCPSQRPIIRRLRVVLRIRGSIVASSKRSMAFASRIGLTGFPAVSPSWHSMNEVRHEHSANEGHHSRWRKRHAASSDDARAVQTADPCL